MSILPKNRYKTEVHIGLLVLICLLLLLNVSPNYTLFSLRRAIHDSATSDMAATALTISRQISEASLDRVPDSLLNRLRAEHGLAELVILPSRPSDLSPQRRREYLVHMVERLPLRHIPDLARQVLEPDYKQLTRGEGSEYYYVYPVPPPSRRLVIFSRRVPELAFLDDARISVIWVSLAALLLIGLVYLVLFRFILSPFKQMLREANLAGRAVERGEDEVDTSLREYRRIISDLTQKQAQLTELNAAIQGRADHFEQFSSYLLSTMVTGIVSVDSERRPVTVNLAAIKTLVGVHEQIEPLTGHLLLEYPDLQEMIDHALDSRAEQPYREIRLMRRDGTDAVVGAACSPVLDNRQELIGATLTLNDLTEVRQLQVELEQKRQLAALGEMSAGLAHQMRNSMGAMMGYARLLQKRLTRDGQDDSAAVTLVDEVHEAESLIERFLHFSRPLELNPVNQSLSEFLTDLADSYRDRLTGSSRLDLQIGDQPEEVSFDPLLLKQALTNLLDNAYQAAPADAGLVTLTCAAHDSDVVIRVIDNGDGIPEGLRKKIFTPFFSSRPAGTGLGLPIAGKIADLHGGSLAIEWTGDRGTAFRLKLPKRCVAAVSSASPA